MSNTKQSPVRGGLYTLNEILFHINLLDSPCLLVRIHEGSFPIQDSHMQFDELKEHPEILDTKWEYQYTTSEWIPVFYYLPTDENEPNPILDLISVENDINSPTEKWVTWKAFPCTQINWNKE